jgi:CRP-like cAMP-binding protein
MTVSAPRSSPRRLGAYVGLPPAEIDAALDEHAPRAGPAPRIGQVLLSAGLLTPGDLEDALQRQRADRLRSCTLFDLVPEATLRELAGLAREVSVPAGERFIVQDRVEPCLYVVVSGRVRVYRTDDSGGEVEFNVAGPGEPLGELGYFGDGRRSASVRALEPVELLRIDYADLERCFQLAPQIALGLLDTVSERLRRQSFLYEESTQRRTLAERSLRHLSEFLNLSDATALGHGIEDLIEQVVHTASRVMGADRATLFLLDRSRNELWSMVAESEERRQIRVPADAGLAGWVVQHGEILHVPDAYADPRFNPEVDRRTGYRTHDLLCGPVRNLSGELIGVVQVINRGSA